MHTISWDDVAQGALRRGRITRAEPFPKARKPAHVLHVDYGEDIGVKKSSAPITEPYSPEELVGRLLVSVLNFPKKQIGPLMSECLVTGCRNES